MVVRQLSVFLENEEGTLSNVFNVLRNANVNVASCSLAETKDYGILRIIVDNTDKAIDVLKRSNIAVKETNVLAVNIPHTVGSLSNVLNALAAAGVNIKYMYGLSTGKSGASIALKVDDNEAATAALEPLAVTYYTAADFQNL